MILLSFSCFFGNEWPSSSPVYRIQAHATPHETPNGLIGFSAFRAFAGFHTSLVIFTLLWNSGKAVTDRAICFLVLVT